MRIVIIGKGLMLANLILGATDSGAEIVGVLRYEQTSTNPFKLFFNDTFNPNSELILIRQLKLKLLKFKSVNSNDFRKFLIRENVDLLVVGTWRERIKKETFNIPAIGTINAHPSLLPAYRGANPYLQTILHGENFSGITLHLIDENYDTGAILAQRKIKIKPKDTSKELRQRTVIAARQLFGELLKDLDNQIVPAIPQNEKYSSYFPNITGEERMLNFNTMTSVEISRTIRALYPFLPCYITVGKNFYITDPYNFEIMPESAENAQSGHILKNDLKHKSLSIVCSDKKVIKFMNLRKYKRLW